MLLCTPNLIVNVLGLITSLTLPWDGLTTKPLLLYFITHQTSIPSQEVHSCMLLWLILELLLSFTEPH